MARRRELWLALALFLVLSVAALLVSAQPGHRWLAPYLHALTCLALAAMVAVMVRRLHDIGQKGGWVALILFPPAFVILLAVLLFRRSSRRRYEMSSLEMGIGVATVALLLLLAVMRLLWFPLRVAEDNMTPAVFAGDLVLARYIDAADVERGDVVVLRRAKDQGLALGRVIGLPGDTVQMRGGKVLLNGGQVRQLPAGTLTEIMGPRGPRALRPRCSNGVVGDGGTCHKAMFEEAVPEGRSYHVLEIEDGGFSDDTDLFTLAPEEYFLLGDNRDNSFDSRFPVAVDGFGPVAAADVIARVDRVLLSARGVGVWEFWTWRLDRFFEAVR